jgi:UDP-glucose-4-epimerase GalE
MNVLVTGGAGYIGSHTVKRLKETGHQPVIYDNLSRGFKGAIETLQVPAVIADLNDSQTLAQTLRDHRIDTVMHFAAFAYVGESVEQPLLYYQNNVASTLNLLQAMQDVGVRRLVFSSTCAVYGNPERIPVSEDEATNPVSPYGRSKLQIEQILHDTASAWPEFRFAALRYFNASGCAMDGLLGEHHDPETHLIPLVLQTLLGRRKHFTIFGTDYPTPDGTNIRDFIHVDDLADAHIAAAETLDKLGKIVSNLGTGKGYSVKEIIASAERVSGKPVAVEDGPRRPGDAAVLYADFSRASNLLGWHPKYIQIDEIIASALRWFTHHP